MSHEYLLQAAVRVLCASTGRGASLRDPVVLKDGPRSLVLRCSVTGAGEEMSSVIIKHNKDDAARGFTDWASLEFLAQIPTARGIVPRFFGGDIAGRFFVMEDLLTSRSLETLLNGDDPGAARVALLEMATQMARLHAATAGAAEAFESLRAALPESTGHGRHVDAQIWFEGRSKIRDWFDALGCRPLANFDSCLAVIREAYSEPGDFLAFTHGDPAPSNAHFANGTACLLDFEYGGYRHALYDIAAWQILCPLPMDSVGAMRECFRAELAKTFSAARDEERFAREWAYMCAYRALAILTWIAPAILTNNAPWADCWTRRQAVLAAVSRLEEVAAPIATLQPVWEAARELSTALRTRWPEYAREEELLPRWRALERR